MTLHGYICLLEAMEYFLHLFQVGGFMMYPLLLASVLVVAIAAERMIYYRRCRTDMKALAEKLPALLKDNRLTEAKKVAASCDGIVGQLTADAVAHVGTVSDISEYLSGTCAHAAGDLKAFLNYVSAIVTLSPLMGLLGTVIGMIGAFDVLSIAEGQPFAVTGGVAEALVATGFGLFVAILAMVVHVVLSQWANHLISDIESGASLFLSSLSKETQS